MKKILGLFCTILTCSASLQTELPENALEYLFQKLKINPTPTPPDLTLVPSLRDLCLANLRTQFSETLPYVPWHNIETVETVIIEQKPTNPEFHLQEEPAQYSSWKVAQHLARRSRIINWEAYQISLTRYRLALFYNLRLINNPVQCYGIQAPNGFIAINTLDDSLLLTKDSPLPELLETNLFVTSMAFSDDGKLLATATKNNGILIWDTESLQVVCILPNLETSTWIRGLRLIQTEDSAIPFIVVSLVNHIEQDAQALRIWTLSQELLMSKQEDARSSQPTAHECLIQ